MYMTGHILIQNSEASCGGLNFALYSALILNVWNIVVAFKAMCCHQSDSRMKNASYYYILLLAVSCLIIQGIYFNAKSSNCFK